MNSSNPANDRLLASASEEATRRNVTAAVEHVNATRSQVQALGDQLRRVANDGAATRELVGRINETFAAAMTKVLALEARVAELERKTGDGTHD